MPDNEPTLSEGQGGSAVTKHFVLPTPGEKIKSELTKNTYRIGDRIGEGSFGIVFKCTDVWDNNLALKVLKPQGTYDFVRQKAVSELNKLLTLRHPHVTYVHDAFEFRDTFHIVTELCDAPLSVLFTINAFNGKHWLKPIARCLLQAVHYLHVNNFVHQDIHPGNVLYSFVKDEMVSTEAGAIQFKLGDLGIAKLLHEVGVDNTRAQWMLPPEVLDSGEFGLPDFRVDIYHLGLLLLQIAHSKEMRFSREEILAGRPRELALTLPAPMSTAIEKALRRHVEHRTKTPMEIWEDLNAPGLLEGPLPSLTDVLGDGPSSNPS